MASELPEGGDRAQGEVKCLQLHAYTAGTGGITIDMRGATSQGHKRSSAQEEEAADSSSSCSADRWQVRLRLLPAASSVRGMSAAETSFSPRAQELD